MLDLYYLDGRIVADDIGEKINCVLKVGRRKDGRQVVIIAFPDGVKLKPGDGVRIIT